MQLGYGKGVIPPPSCCGLGKPMLGDQENLIFTTQKDIGWIIYSFFT